MTDAEFLARCDASLATAPEALAHSTLQRLAQAWRTRAKEAEMEAVSLRAALEAAYDRIAQQADQLSKNAEKAGVEG